MAYSTCIFYLRTTFFVVFYLRYTFTTIVLTVVNDIAMPGDIVEVPRRM